MNRSIQKNIRRVSLAAVALAFAVYFMPTITLLFLALGLIDVMRNDRKDWLLFRLYFMGNGIITWLLSPFNLFIDLISDKNRKVWALEDFPDAHRKEIDHVLEVFRSRKTEIVADIDRQFDSGKRGMYVYQWYGKQHIDNIPEFTREFDYIKTIAVSVFSGRESTSYHYGPLRLTLRVLYNLTPVDTDGVFIECGNTKNFWHENPLFVFDDTLLHRSVNEYDGRRYCVFMDIIRPSPYPALLAALLRLVAFSVDRVNAMFYKNWTMIDARKPKDSSEVGKL